MGDHVRNYPLTSNGDVSEPGSAIADWRANWMAVMARYLSALVCCICLHRCCDGPASGFRDARLDEADLRGARLGGAFLIGASLRGADLRGAYVRLAKFDGADLSGANLDEVIGLTQAQFDRARWDRRIRLPKGMRDMADDEG